MEINITYKSPEHEAAFLSELQRVPHIVNPESGRINPYWGASLYLLSALTRWPELRIAVIGEDYMAFTAAKVQFKPERAHHCRAGRQLLQCRLLGNARFRDGLRHLRHGFHAHS